MTSRTEALVVSLQSRMRPEVARELARLRPHFAGNQGHPATVFPFEQWAQLFETMRRGGAKTLGHLFAAGAAFNTSVLVSIFAPFVRPKRS